MEVQHLPIQDQMLAQSQSGLGASRQDNLAVLTGHQMGGSEGAGPSDEPLDSTPSICEPGGSGIVLPLFEWENEMEDWRPRAVRLCPAPVLTLASQARADADRAPSRRRSRWSTSVYCCGSSWVSPLWRTSS